MTKASESALSLPRGGGAVRGIGETFQANPFSGTGSFRVPLAVSGARASFHPEISLEYGSGNGNGPFGLGWRLGIPRITRKTEKGLPRYEDDDTFVMSGAEDLVPVLDETADPDGGPPVWSARPPTQRGTYLCYAYRPRTEGLFARIEKWVDRTDVHWRATTKDNITSVYGRTDNARLLHPDRGRPFEWLLQESYDAKGNHILYEYAAEDPELTIEKLSEQNRSYSQKYIRRIFYGVHRGPAGVRRTATDHDKPTHTLERRYLFELTFDYGDDPSAAPAVVGTQEATTAWPLRPDPFSSYRAGFELRTLRRCERVLVHHHMPELEQKLVKSTNFVYEQDAHTKLSLLNEVVLTGHQKSGDREVRKSLPAVGFAYSRFQPEKQRYQSVSAEGHLPSFSLADEDTTLVDLSGDGLPDIVETRATGFRYWRNRGRGRFAAPHPMHGTPLGLSLAQPGVRFADLNGNGRTDLLVLDRPVQGYFETTEAFETVEETTWETLSWKRFRSIPHAPVDLSDPNARLLDLTGDGRSDVLISRDHHFVWHECRGDEGFSEARAVVKKNGLEGIHFHDPSGRVRLADMTGDGLQDIVLVHNGRVDYWPNLGYGDFGRRITMERSPELERPFDPNRLFLADLDGSGCADLVYVGASSLTFWFNQSGNGWSEPQLIPGTPPVTDRTAVRFADLFGTGTASLVWSYDAGTYPGSNYKVLDFCGGTKPYLLVEMSNNMGATTRVSYASSSHFQLQDEVAGEAWASKLPFPVQVVDRVETIDHVSKSKLVRTFSYHHGYFDGDDREFRGFGRVEQRDTEVFEDFAGGGLHRDPDLFANDLAEYHVPPVLTKTWFHTGAYRSDTDLRKRYEREYYQGDGSSFELPDDDFGDDDFGDRRSREAQRALRGARLRQEVYALDGTDREPHPYLVSESSYQVRRLQAKADNAHGVYLVTPRTSLDSHYERDPSDPRVRQTLALPADADGNLTDAFGNVTDSVTVAYPRRAAPGNEAEQNALQVLYSKTEFINESTATHHYAGVPYQTRSYELLAPAWPKSDPRAPLSASDFQVHVADPDDYLAYDASPADPGAPGKRLVEWTRNYFKRDGAAASLDDNARLPLGRLERQALPFESYRAALTSDLVETIYGQRGPGDPRVTTAMLEAAGYHREADAADLWWLPSGRQAFDAERFLLVSRQRDPFGNATRLEYDAYHLLLEKTTDALGNEVRAEALDYRVLRPSRLKDPNHNLSEVAYDALGFVVGTAVRGNGGEGDDLHGFEANLSEQEVRRQLADPLGRMLGRDPQDVLGNASSRIIYDLHRFADFREPPAVYSLSRETHASDAAAGTPSKLRHGFLYSDGFGREVQRKVQAEAGPAPPRDPVTTDLEVDAGNTRAVDPRWVGTGWTIFDNKSQPVRRYEPFFTDSHAYEAAIRKGVSATLFYDPLGRVVATLHPNHSYEKVVFDAWRQSSWDVNDTTTLNPGTDDDVKGLVKPYLDRLEASSGAFETWFEQRHHHPDVRERDAASKAAAHAATPTTSVLDPQGRTFLRSTDLPVGDRRETVATRTAFDIEGNDRSLTDANGVVAFRHRFDLAGRKLAVDSVDAGRKRVFFDALGSPVASWDAKDTETRTVYDALRRPTHRYVREAGSNARLAERTLYGEHHPDSADPATSQRNLRGQAFMQFDGAGTVRTGNFDFKGNPLRSRRQLRRDYKTPADWSSIEPLLANAPVDLGALTAALGPLLETDVYESRNRYDALNRIVRSTAPDGSTYLPRYNEGNLLEGVRVAPRGQNPTDLVTNIDYDEKGQRERVDYANGTRTSTTYDPATFRLVQLKTTRSTGSRTYQDLRYTYDPVGNITHLIDEAQQTVYFDNGVVKAENHYRYDALYRLTEATGREHRGQAGSAGSHGHLKPHFDPDDLTRRGLAHRADGQKMQRYSRRYSHDANGNILTLQHRANGRGWTRHYRYEPTGNRLASTSLPGDDASAPDFPRSLPPRYPHDANGNITQMPHLAALAWDAKDQLVEVDLGGGGTAHYQYDGARQRVRKVVEKGSVREERIYLGAFEIYRRFEGGTLKKRRETLHVMDDRQRIALVETLTHDDGNAVPDPDPVLRYQLANHLGSSLVELDENAQVIGYEEYYPYGSTSFQQARSGVGLSQKRYRYSGKERDEETGFYYYGARYLASWLGRWMSCDPMGAVDGLNLFVFTVGNPINRLDGLGFQSESHEDEMCLVSQDGQSTGESVRPPPTVSVARKLGEVLDQSGSDYYRAMTPVDEVNLRTKGKLVPNLGEKGKVKPTRPPLAKEKMSARQASPASVKRKGSNRISFTKDPNGAIGRAAKERGLSRAKARKHVIRVEPQKLKLQDEGRFLTNKELMADVDRYSEHRLSKGQSATNSEIRQAKKHYPKFREGQVVGELPKSEAKKLKVFQGRGKLVFGSAALVLEATKDTPVSYSEDGSRRIDLGVDPTTAAFDPHAYDKMTDEFDYHYQQYLYDQGLRETEPVAPWTPVDQNNVLGEFGVWYWEKLDVAYDYYFRD